MSLGKSPRTILVVFAVTAMAPLASFGQSKYRPFVASPKGRNPVVQDNYQGGERTQRAYSQEELENSQEVLRQVSARRYNQQASANEKIAEPNAKADMKPAANAELISRGESSFSQSCTSCHDAEKSLSKSKSEDAWRSTIQRMALKEGADVPADSVDAIAAYLASRSTSTAGAAAGDNEEQAAAGAGCTDDAPSLSVYGTLSPTWRGGAHDVQNQGFFPDVWLGAAWQGKSALSAKVTSCVTCHGSEGGNNIEFVEASMRLDLTKALDCPNPNFKSAVEAGRFVVPFGAFSKQVNPGVYRSVSRPLIYNMGQRVYDDALSEPVLPMPYSDQGVSYNFGSPVVGDVDFNWTAYAVNGLQSSATGIDFDATRNSYVDNNSRPSLGTRLTAGTNNLQFGGSFMAGQSSPTGGLGANNEALYYRVYGADVTYRYLDILRVQAEYARRDSDRIVSLPNDFRTREHFDGYYIESELLIWREKKISLYGRYDHQHTSSLVPPDGSSLATSHFGVSRMTYGVNFVLPGGSLLMINSEHWFLSDGLSNANVIGARWACTF